MAQAMPAESLREYSLWHAVRNSPFGATPIAWDVGPDGICIGMQKQVPEEKRQPKTHEPSRLHSRGSEFPLCNLMQGNVRMSSK